jgi:tRNA threonylcarbamoyladenosine modification (KEOPS) complex Cgi121 subunit
MFMSPSSPSMVFQLRTPRSRKTVGVAGGRTSTADPKQMLQKLEEIDRARGTVSQVFDASSIAGPRHLVHAARLAIAARDGGRGLADSLRMDLMCWVAGERRIGEALRKVGLQQNGREFAFLVVGDSTRQVMSTLADIFKLGTRRDDKLLKLRPKKEEKLSQLFSISQKELDMAPIGDLILERVALLSLEG